MNAALIDFFSHLRAAETNCEHNNEVSTCNVVMANVLANGCLVSELDTKSNISIHLDSKWPPDMCTCSIFMLLLALF